MHESQPGGPGGDYRPQHGRAGQPDQPGQQPGDDWFRPPRGQPHEPAPREPGPRKPGPLEPTRLDLPAVYGGRPNLPANRPLNVPVNRPPNLPVGRPLYRPLDRPRFNPFLRVTSVDLLSLTVLEERKPGRNWALVGTVFFLADTVLMAEGFTRPVATQARVLVIFIWLISVGAAVLLWLRGSAKFSSFLKSAKFPSFFNSRQSARNPRAHSRSAHSRRAN
jgi:hypothetical protein